MKQTKKKDSFEFLFSQVEFYELNGKEKAKFLKSYIARQGWKIQDKIQSDHIKRIENVPFAGPIIKRNMEGKSKGGTIEGIACQICYLSPTYISDCGHTYCCPCLVKLDAAKGALCAVCRKKFIEIFEIKKLSA